MLKNTAGQKFTVIAFNEGGRVSGIAASITCTLSIDAGARSALSDTNPTEIGTSGQYEFDLAQAETNGHELSFDPSSSTAGVQVLGSPSNVIYTTITTSGSGASSGNLNNIDEIIIGDDYVADNLRQLYVDITPGYVPVSCQIGGRGKLRLREWATSGSVVSLGGGSYRLLFDVLRTDTAELLSEKYDISVEAVDASGDEHTVLRKVVPHVYKQT